MVGLLGFAHCATAGAVVTYDEAVEGDLPTNVGPPVFAFDVGTNSFTGTQTLSNEPTVPSDRDSFRFGVPAGARLDSIIVTTNLLPVGGGVLDRLGVEVRDASGGAQLGFFSTPVPSTRLRLDAANLLIDEGIYSHVSSLAGSVGPGEFRTLSYTFEFNVAPVVGDSVIGLDMEIVGIPNQPSVIIANTSAGAAELVEFVLTVGDKDFNFDGADASIIVDAGDTLTSTLQTPDSFRNGGIRDDKVRYTFEGFDRGDALVINFLDIDSDSGDSSEDFRNVFFNNGLAPNSVVSATFLRDSGRSVLRAELPDSPRDAPTLHQSLRGSIGPDDCGGPLPVLAVDVPGRERLSDSIRRQPTLDQRA